MTPVDKATCPARLAGAGARLPVWQSAGSGRHPAPAMRLGPVELGTYGYYPVFVAIAPFSGLVVVAFDLAEVGGLSEAGMGVQVACVCPQVRVVRQPP